MKKYTTIYFDLDNTLLDFYKTEKRAIKNTLKLHGLPDDDATAKLYSDINRSFWERYERGEIPRDDIFEGRFHVLLDTLNTAGDPAAICRDYFGFLASGHDIVDGADGVLSRLKAAGYKIYATTNGIAATQYKRIEESGLAVFFDDVFVSETVGCQKPERGYFDFVMSKTREKDKSKILVIGDSQSSDILGGINAGLDTCWYRHAGETQKYKSNYVIDSLEEIFEIL